MQRPIWFKISSGHFHRQIWDKIKQILQRRLGYTLDASHNKPIFLLYWGSSDPNWLRWLWICPKCMAFHFMMERAGICCLERQRNWQVSSRIWRLYRIDAFLFYCLLAHNVGLSCPLPESSDDFCWASAWIGWHLLSAHLDSPEISKITCFH